MLWAENHEGELTSWRFCPKSANNRVDRIERGAREPLLRDFSECLGFLPGPLHVPDEPRARPPLRLTNPPALVTSQASR